MALHNILGNKGEILAARYLAEQGLAVLEYNWRSGHKEIDLIAKERDVLVFVEVKTRSSNAFGDIREAITPQKMRNVIIAAEAYVKQKECDLDMRFDVVTILAEGNTYRIEHVRDAFYPDLE